MTKMSVQSKILMYSNVCAMREIYFALESARYDLTPLCLLGGRDQRKIKA